MKTLFIFLVFSVAFSGWTRSQNYYVINTEGKIYTGDKLLRTGDKLSDESSITFSAASDKLYLMSPAKGNFLITPSATADRNLPGWIITLKNAAIPQNKFYKTASRSNESRVYFDDVYDLMGFFRDRVMITGAERFSLNTEKIPLDKDNYFEFRNMTGREDADTLHYEVGESFFTLDSQLSGDPLLNEFEMQYVRGGNKTVIGKFFLKKKNKQELIDEISVFFNHRESVDPAIIFLEQILPYISQCYGNTQTDALKEIIRKDLQVVLNLRE